MIDIFDLTADEIIECKLIGTGASLGQAAGQFRRYSKSFPGTALSIAVRYIEPDAEWLAVILRGQGLAIIELDPAIPIGYSLVVRCKPKILKILAF